MFLNVAHRILEMIFTENINMSLSEKIYYSKRTLFGKKMTESINQMVLE